MKSLLRTAVRVATTAAFGCASLLSFLPPASAANAWMSFDVVAAASGVHVVSIVPGGVLDDQMLDVGAPSTFATIDALGGSRARAAMPFPGDLALTVPGIASGVVGRTVPEYPLIAASSHPTQPETATTVGPYALNASSSRASSVAETTSQLPAAAVSQTRSSVAHRSDDLLTASSESVTRGLVLGSVVVGTVVARASAQRAMLGDVVRSFEFEVTGLSVGSTQIDVPVPETGPVRDALEAHGIAIRVVEAQETPGGIVAPALEVRLSVPVSATGSGSSTVIYTVGGAWVSIVAASETILPVDERPELEPSAPSPTVTQRTVVLGERVAPSPAVETPRPSTTPVAIAEPRPRPVERWPSALYLLAGLSGLAAAGVVLFVRCWGVRRTWVS